MLKPKYLEQLPDSMVELYSQAEMDILADMARRISTYDYFIPAAQWQYKKLIEMGNYHSHVVQTLSSLTGRTKREIESLMQESGQKALHFDDSIYRKAGLNPPPLSASPALQGVLTSGVEKTNGLFRNLTRTTANTSSKQFEHALDQAYMQITSGAFDYNTAIRSTIKGLAEKGIASVQYPTGRIEYIETAVRRATLTGVNQTALKLQDARADEMGCDLVETTAHAGARPSHAEWQGKIFSRSGTHRKYPDFVKSTGYGTGPGLGGWNCRHSYFPYFEGLSSAAYDRKELAEMNAKTITYNGEKLTEYEASQKQRYIERQLRRWKREYVGMDAAGLPTEEAAAKIAQWGRVQNDFLEQTGFKRQADREQIAGFGRSEAAKARAVAGKTKISASEIEKGGIIDTNKAEPNKNNAVANFDKAFHKALDHGKTTGNECLLWLNLDGEEVVKIAAGDKSSVAINHETLDYLSNAKKNTVISLHNHPGSSAFSPEDMNIACYFESVKEMRVIGHDGTKYYLDVTGGERPSLSEIREAYNKIKDETYDKYYEVFTKTQDAAATWKEQSNEISETMAKKFKWTYRRELE